MVVTIILVAALAAGEPAGTQDVVVLRSGERIVGLVFEAGPSVGVSIKLEDGTIRHFSQAEIARIEWAEPEPKSATPRVSPAPPAGPEVPPPGKAPAGQAIEPELVTFSLGLGAAGSWGRVSSNLGATSAWWDSGPAPLLYLDGGLRVTPKLALVLSIDVGLGDASAAIMDWCEANGHDCGSAVGALAVQARYAFTPAARTTTWVAIGTGLELAQVDISEPGLEFGYGNDETISFSGWEILKLGAGMDWRAFRAIGFGLFAYGSVGRLSEVEIDGPPYLVPDEFGTSELNFRFCAGARGILFP